MCRHGCYGSAAASYPAVLPLITLLPKELVQPDPRHMQQLLEAVLTGWAGFSVGAAAGSASSAQAAASCYLECWRYIVSQVCSVQRHLLVEGL